MNKIEEIQDITSCYCNFPNKSDFTSWFYGEQTIDEIYEGMWELVNVLREIKNIVDK